MYIYVFMQGSKEWFRRKCCESKPIRFRADDLVWIIHLEFCDAHRINLECFLSLQCAVRYAKLSSANSLAHRLRFNAQHTDFQPRRCCAQRCFSCSILRQTNLSKYQSFIAWDAINWIVAINWLIIFVRSWFVHAYACVVHMPIALDSSAFLHNTECRWWWSKITRWV